MKTGFSPIPFRDWARPISPALQALLRKAYLFNSALIGALPLLFANGVTGAGVIVAAIDCGIRPGFPHISLDGSVIGCQDLVGDAPRLHQHRKQLPRNIRGRHDLGQRRLHILAASASAMPSWRSVRVLLESSNQHPGSDAGHRAAVQLVRTPSLRRHRRGSEFPHSRHRSSDRLAQEVRCRRTRPASISRFAT